MSETADNCVEILNEHDENATSVQTQHAQREMRITRDDSRLGELDPVIGLEDNLDDALSSAEMEKTGEANQATAGTSSGSSSANILEEYRAATLKLLDEVESEIAIIPESNVSEETNVTPEVSIEIGNLGQTIDLTKQDKTESRKSSEVTTISESDVSEDTNRTHVVETEKAIDLTEADSIEIVTLTSDSSAESDNSRSSSKDDAEVTVDLTNEQISTYSSSVPDVSKVLPNELSTSGEPASKRQKVKADDSIQVDLTEDSNMSAEDDIVMVQETNDSVQAEEIKHDIPQSESVFEFKGPPRQLTGAWECFRDPDKNYLRGCKWAPDGTCLLTNSNDNKLKIFNLPDELYYNGGENKSLPEMTPVLAMKEADTVYDFCWYPLMSSSSPETACLAVTTKDTPIHLYDAFTGELRCSYRAYNHVDEVVAAYCVDFSRDGNKLYCGFNKMIRVFDVTRPGRDFENRPTFAKDGQRGIISCIEHSPTEPGLYAAGSYSRSIALYNEPAGSMVCMFEGQHGGVTQVKFSPDGTRLYSGGRKDNEILCWDMRNPGHILFSLLRTVVTNQRIYFDITSDSKYLVSGSHDGTVLVWDTTSAPVQLSVHSDPVIQPTMAFEGHKDTVNGVSLHPSLPVIATASGQRHFLSVDSDDDAIDVEDDRGAKIDNSLRLWWT